MRISVLFWIFLAILIVGPLPGCGGGREKSAAPETTGVEAEPAKGESKGDIKSYEITDLPPVDEPLQRALDGGRLEICPPADWGFFSQANYLVVFAKGKVSELPRVTVAAVDSPYGADETDEENGAALAKKIQKRLVKDKKNVRENPKPIKLGGRVWVRHVRQVSQGGTPCAVQSLQTVHSGRLYTLELFSAAKNDAPASLDTAVKLYRDNAYAVAANVRFKEPEAAVSPPPTTEEKPAEKPTEKPAEAPPAEKPAEAKPAEKKNE